MNKVRAKKERNYLPRVFRTHRCDFVNKGNWIQWNVLIIFRNCNYSHQFHMVCKIAIEMRIEIDTFWIENMKLELHKFCIENQMKQYYCYLILLLLLLLLLWIGNSKFRCIRMMKPPKCNNNSMTIEMSIEKWNLYSMLPTSVDNSQRLENWKSYFEF